MNYQQRGLRALYEYRVTKRLGVQKEEEVNIPDDPTTSLLKQLAEENRSLKLRVTELEAQLKEVPKKSPQPSLSVDLLEFTSAERESFVVRALCQELAKKHSKPQE
mmetsp:Transcript_10493/g.20187  ORF Transcript_10493/g.20187 Transcript_10493/m.20187 type:complete len:106 (+) Transcript_10493:3-320(+)